MLHSGMGESVRHAKWLWIGWILAAAAVLLLAVESAAGRWLPAATAAQGGAVIYVDDSAVGGSNDGSSWANAFLDLQDALKIAQAGDEIRIGQGTYRPAPPNGDRAISFNLVSGVVMQGGYAGFGASDPDALDHVAFPTILSGDLNGDDQPTPTALDDNSYHVVRAQGVDATTAIRGVTMERGNADVAGQECPGEPPLQSQGGGISCSDADLLMTDCVVRDNRASCQGGGIWFNGGSPVFLRCAFVGNRTGPAEFSYGAGAYCTASATFIDCQFVQNSSAHGAGAAWIENSTFRGCQFKQNMAGEIGGALIGGNLALIDCAFDENTSSTFIGGVTGANLTLVNCSFTRHHAICGPILGAALRMNGNSLVVNCLFAGNRAPAIVATGTSNTIQTSTIIGNRDCDGGILVVGGHVTLSNSIVWDNSETTPLTDSNQVILGPGGTVSTNHSVIHGWTGSLGGTGNHGNDPRFIDADGPDNIYGTADDNPRLLANSPCINAGDSGLLPPDQFDLDDDGDTTEPLPIDLDGLPRIVGANVDMGAFEFQSTPCRADIDGNGSVAVNDLLAVITNWGPCIPGQMCNSDLDLNGEVAVNDLLMVITTWGPCQ